MLWLPLSLLVALSAVVSADIEFTSPKPGETFKAGETVSIEWKDSGSGPKISELTTYELFLFAGGNTADSMMQLDTVVGGAPTFTTTGNKAARLFASGLGASTPKNAYFFAIKSTSAKGGIITNYSPRFSFSGMTGTFQQTVLDGMKDVDGTDGPPTEDNTGKEPLNPGAPEYDVEYTMQTGVIRYAPMQPVPATKITKKEHQPAYPTSSVKIATAMLPPPKQQSTQTNSQTFSVSSRENTAAPAPMPSDDMAKFLARWKD